MAEQYMSAREAWEISILGCPPVCIHDGEPCACANDVAVWTRACAIVEACVKEHEALDTWFNDATSSWNLVRQANVHARALERGEELTC